MRYIVILSVSLIIASGCNSKTNNEKILEDRAWSYGETGFYSLYLQNEDKKAYMWNVKITKEARNDSRLNMKDFVKPKGTPKTNPLPTKETEASLRSGWDLLGSYTIEQDTLYLRFKNKNYIGEGTKKFFIAKAYDTLINNKSHKAVQLYRHDVQNVVPVTFISKDE